MLIDIRLFLHQWVLADAGVAALIGTRFFPIRLQQGEIRPSAVYTRIGGTGGHTMQGPDSLVTSRFQIDAYAQTAGASNNVAMAIKLRLDGFRGRIQLPGSPVRIARVQGVFFASERELYDETSKLWRNSRDYLVHHEERV